METMEQKIELLVESILLDYQKGRDIDRIDHTSHPDKDVIVDMTGKLMRILYPGYSLDKTYRMYHPRHNLSMLIEDVVYHLNQQLALVMADAENVSIAFMERLPQIRALAQTDVDAAFEGDLLRSSPGNDGEKHQYCYVYPQSHFSLITQFCA